MHYWAMPNRRMENPASSELRARGASEQGGRGNVASDSPEREKRWRTGIGRAPVVRRSLSRTPCGELVKAFSPGPGSRPPAQMLARASCGGLTSFEVVRTTPSAKCPTALAIVIQCGRATGRWCAQPHTSCQETLIIVCVSSRAIRLDRKGTPCRETPSCGDHHNVFLKSCGTVCRALLGMATLPARPVAMSRVCASNMALSPRRPSLYPQARLTRPPSRRLMCSNSRSTLSCRLGKRFRQSQPIIQASRCTRGTSM